VTEETRPPSDLTVHPVVLYDGVCGLCNWLVQFILRRDPAGMFRFASLQSGLAGTILARHGTDAADLDTVYVVVNAEQGGEVLLLRSEAVIFILRHLGAAELRSAGQPGAAVPTDSTATPTPGFSTGYPFWRLLGLLLQVGPRRVRDWGYGMVARNRYRIFGRYDSCPVPSEETRGRFLG
jgi:predicted DCC family thiol-disulfide oxidoreductase YuxK